MAVPEFDALKIPVLQLLADGQPRKLMAIESELADHLDLSEDDRNEVLPSGTERRFHNRTGWACYDLMRAGLLTRPSRGIYQVTQAGMELLRDPPAQLDRQFLMRYPSFAEWMQATSAPKTKSDTAQPAAETADTDATPLEAVETAYQTLKGTLKAELREMLAQTDPYRFEQVVLDLLVAMGYGGSRAEAAQVTKASNDEGIDGVINEDRLGLDVIYVQAKRWKEKVGRKEIQSFVGALAGQQAHKGVFITTGGFADTALIYADNVPQKVILIDGDRLADLMIEHNIGVSVETAYTIKRIDSDYFED